MNPSVPQPLPGENGLRLELHLASHTAELAKARKAVEHFAAHHGFSENAQAQVGLCVNEAMANVIRHAYGGTSGKPILLIADYDESPDLGSAALRIAIRDWGNGRDPSEMPPKPYNALEPGGVGLICMRRMMDEVTYTPQPDGMLLTLVKRK